MTAQASRVPVGRCLMWILRFPSRIQPFPIRSRVGVSVVSGLVWLGRRAERPGLPGKRAWSRVTRKALQKARVRCRMTKMVRLKAKWRTQARGLHRLLLILRGCRVRVLCERMVTLRPGVSTMAGPRLRPLTLQERQAVRLVWGLGLESRTAAYRRCLPAPWLVVKLPTAKNRMVRRMWAGTSLQCRPALARLRSVIRSGGARRRIPGNRRMIRTWLATSAPGKSPLRPMELWTVLGAVHRHRPIRMKVRLDRSNKVHCHRHIRLRMRLGRVRRRCSPRPPATTAVDHRRLMWARPVPSWTIREWQSRCVNRRRGMR